MSWNKQINLNSYNTIGGTLSHHKTTTNKLSNKKTDKINVDLD